MSLSLDNLGPRAKAVDLAKTVLKIFEQIESPKPRPSAKLWPSGIVEPSQGTFLFKSH